MDFLGFPLCGALDGDQSLTSWRLCSTPFRSVLDAVFIRGRGIPLNETTRRNFRGPGGQGGFSECLQVFPVLPVVLKGIFTSLQCVPSSVMLLRNVSAASKVDTTVTRPMTTT